MGQSIVVDKLSKRYQLGRLKHETMLRDVLVDLIRHPGRRPSKAKQFIYALEDVSFSVQEGESVGVIGRNGAGKTTLLKILSKITYPTSGSVGVRGLVASLLEIGTGFHEELTGRENVYLNGSILGMTRKEISAKMDAIVAFAGVEKFIDTPIKKFSSGMKVRLGFAVAAHLEPDVLLVDEVLAVGDAEFQKRCLKTLDDLRSGGRTVLFVSHNMASVENLCSRAIWIEAGRVAKDGEAKEVVRSYLSSFAATQQTGYNLREVETRSGNGAVRFTGIEFMDRGGNALSLVRSGDDVKVRLHYEATDDVYSPHFGLSVHSELGTLVTTMSTWGTGLEIKHLPPGEGSIDLDIERLNLMPARYYVSLFIQSLGPIRYDVLDHCVTLDVETSDVYKTGKGLGRQWGVVFLPCRWKINANEMGEES